MGVLNVPRYEMEALKDIHNDALAELLAQCIREERTSPIRILRLDDCGPYVASRLRGFEIALEALQKAKSAKKRAESEYELQKAARNLTHAVHQMKDRVAIEEREGLLFFVDDQVMPPLRLSEQLTVRISYQVRPSVADQWVIGSIVFSHKAVSRPHSMLSTLVRKRSAAKLERIASRTCTSSGSIRKRLVFMP